MNKILIGICTTCLCAGLVCVTQAQGTFGKVLFLGNSITSHGPNKGIGWSGNWGMAASAAEKDYVHLVTSGLAARGGAAPKTMVKNIAAFEREYATFDIAPLVEETTAFGADLVIVAVGENTPNPASDAERARFKEAMVKLLKGVKTPVCKTLLVRSCFWANAAKDRALQQACEEVGGRWIDMSALGKDPANMARSERAFPHAGVAGHPGDRGMQAIADALLGALPDWRPAKPRMKKGAHSLSTEKTPIVLDSQEVITEGK